MPDAPTAYEILGVSPDASQEEIRDAYLRLSRQVHSDKGGSDALFRQVKDAYDELRSRGETHGPPPPRAEGQHSDNPHSSTTDDVHVEPDIRPVESNPFKRLWASRPSWVLVGVGFLVSLIGGSAPHTGLVFLGLLILMVGVAGVMGVSRARWMQIYQSCNIQSVDGMSGTQFEHFLTVLFQREGFDAEHIGRYGDFGADLVLRRGNLKVVVQAKRYSGAVGLDAVQQVLGAKAHYRADDAIVVTNSHYTGAARTLAQSSNVTLWDRSTLMTVMARQSPFVPRTGWALLGQELRYGAPRLLLRVVLIVSALLAALLGVAGSTKRRSRRRK